MNKRRLFIYCAGGLGRETLLFSNVVNAKTNQWDEIRFIDDTPELNGQTINGAEVWSFDDYLSGDRYETDVFVIATGESPSRKAIDQKLQKNGCKLTAIVHPDNNVDKSVEIGAGSMIQQSVNSPSPNCKIGRCVQIQGLAALGHGVEVGDYCTISTFAFIGGTTKIGAETYVAPGALLRNGITIGRNCIIGMGSVVTKDIPDNSVVYGNPGRIMRENTSGKVFSK